jgi:hypothetical protein
LGSSGRSVFIEQKNQLKTVSIDFLALLSILRGMSVYLSLSTAQATAQAEGQRAEGQQATAGTAGHSNRQQARQSDSFDVQHGVYSLEEVWVLHIVCFRGRWIEA